MNLFSDNELFSPPLDLIKQAVLETSSEKEIEDVHEFPGVEIVNYQISDDAHISVAKISPSVYDSFKDNSTQIQLQKPCSTCVANETLCLHISATSSLKGKKKLFEAFYDDDSEKFMREFQS